MATWPDLLGIPVFSGYDLETTDPTVRTDMEGGSARVRVSSFQVVTGELRIAER